LVKCLPDRLEHEINAVREASLEKDTH
jgi:hypothetical protein